MANSPDEPSEALAYYRRRLDELAGETLKQDYQIAGLQKEVKQKRRAFALLTELQQTIGSLKEISDIFRAALHAVNATLDMDRTVVLTPTERENVYRPSQWTGFTSEGREAQLSARFTVSQIEFPPEFAGGSGRLIVHKKTEPDALIKELREIFELPYFVCVPVTLEQRPIGLLLTGRVKEAGTVFPPMDQGDVETLQAIAGLISAVVQNMRVAVLQEMDRLKTDFFANISHEFRTPITLTLGPLEGIQNGRYGPISDATRGQVEIMVRNQHRLLGLINQILDLAKIEAGQMKLAASKMSDMNQFIERRVAQFQSMAERRAIELRLSLDPGVRGADVYVDQEHFDKLLFNLLSNAMKFTKRGHVEVATAIGGGKLELTITDTGIGIEEDQLPHIFDRFRQADSSTTRDHAGTGIGLALVREVVKLHGGEINAYSQAGKGTSFKIALPLGSAHLDPACVVDIAGEERCSSLPPAALTEIREGSAEGEGVEPLNNMTAAAVDARRPTVLYVDDNPDLRVFVRDVLAPHYNVFLGVNGEDGLEKTRKYRPDLILSDIMMPVMSGGEFCQRIRSDPDFADLPFVLLTAKASIESKIAGLEEGADDYLNKPFAEAELLARVRNLIRLREKQAHLKRELQAARDIQRSLLPPDVQRFGDVTLEALYHPSEELSGDFFDTITCGEWVYFYLADVTSHGAAAAQVTYLVKGIFDSAVLAAQPPPLQQLVQAANERYATYKLDYDVGIQLARLHLGTRALEYVRGNAPAAVITAPDGRQTLVEPRPGPSLGLRSSGVTGSAFEVIGASVEPGARLCLYTDGAYEFDAGGRPFGRRRLHTLLRDVVGASWKARMLEALVAARGERQFDDDVTILCITVGSG